MFKMFREVSEDMIAYVHFKMLSHTSIDIRTYNTSIIYSHPCSIDFFTSLA